MKGEKRCIQERFWGSTGNLSRNYGFVKDERKWWGGAHISGPQDPKSWHSSLRWERLGRTRFAAKFKGSVWTG